MAAEHFCSVGAGTVEEGGGLKLMHIRGNCSNCLVDFRTKSLRIHQSTKSESGVGLSKRGKSPAKMKRDIMRVEASTFQNSL